MPPAVPAAPPARPDAAAPAPHVVRGHRLLLGLYLLLGLTVSSWLARLPSVRAALDLTTGELGSVLLAGAIGSLATVLVAGGLATRWGSRRTLLVAAGMFTSATVLLGLGPALGATPVLVAGVVLMSMSFALGNVPLNVETVVVERALGRTVVPQFHAAFSIGSVAGSGVGALAAWAGVPVLVQFCAVGALSLVWRIAAVPGAVLPRELPADAADGHEHDGARHGAGVRTALRAWREPATLLVGVIVMAGALTEGTANNWLAVAVVDGFGRSEAVAASVFGVFVAAMTASRLAGTRALDRFGRVPVLTASGVLSLAGLVGFALSPGLPGAVVGVVAWGLGAGLIIPIGMAAVSADPLRAAGRVAVVSAFASTASLAAPPLIGLAAESLGTRHALLLISGALVVGIALARRVPPAPARSASPISPPTRPADRADATDLPVPLPAPSAEVRR